MDMIRNLNNSSANKYSAITWIITGCVLILLPMFIYWAQDNLNRQNRAIRRLLIEKGNTYIIPIELWSSGRTQEFIEQTVSRQFMQQDISYIIITDLEGNIRYHSKPDQVGGKYGQDIDLYSLIKPDTLQGRKISNREGKEIFEVYRQFKLNRQQPPPSRRTRTFQQTLKDMRWQMMQNIDEEKEIIFLGLDMTRIESFSREDTREFIKRGSYLLLIGLAGISLLILFQKYRSAQSSLSRIKALSDNIVENMPIGLIVLDTDFIVASFNYTAETLLRVQGDNIIGKPVKEKLPSQLVELIMGLQGSGKNIIKELEIDLVENGKVYLDINMSKLEDTSGILLGYIILFRDLSEVRELKKEVERSTRLASIGRLAAGVAHEIRNPLSSIKGFATYFGERYRDVPEDKDTAIIMVNEVERLNRVISQLLEFARPVDINREMTDIRTIVNHSTKIIERNASEKDIRLKLEIPGDIPPVAIDSDRIKQVLLNLFLNSIEAMEKGGDITVSVDYDPGSEMIKLVVSDTGKGIDSGDLVNIFDPYFTTKQSGTGLGLAIVHRIIESHDGEIKVESAQGKGTSVIITLPVK